jgi:hypothetical protein
MKLTQFDDLYPASLGMGGTTLIISDGSNSGSTGGDLAGDPGDYDVVGLGGTVSLGSNLSTGVALGDVLTIIQASPATARFATPSNSGGGITVADEGTPLSTAATTLDFTGAGVTASGAGATKTINIPGATSAAAFCGCSVSGTSTVVNGAYASLAFEAADTYDTDAIHDPASNNTRLTVPTGKTGYWLLTAWDEFPTSTTDRRIAYRIDAGTDVILQRQYNADGGASYYVNASIVVYLTATQYVEVRAYNDSNKTHTKYAAQFSFLGA